MQFILGIDIGTSGVKAVLVDTDQNVVASHAIGLSTLRPYPLWSQQHPEQWWQAVVECVTFLLRAAAGSAKKIMAIGLTGQMHGVVALGDDLKPLCPALLWNDGRAAGEARLLHAEFPKLAQRLGVVPMAGMTAPKLLWLKHHLPEIFGRIHLVLSPKDYIGYKLTGTAVTDFSDGAGTWLFDQQQRVWSKEAVTAVGLRPDQLPEIRESTSLAGYLHEHCAAALGLPAGTPVAVGGGDTPAGAVGFGCIQPGEAVISLGTSAHIFTTTSRYAPAVDRMIHSFCHALPHLWYQMAAMLNGASCLQWLSAILDMPVDEMNSRLEQEFKGPGELLFLPYLSGERTPHNNPLAKGVFFGLTPATGKSALCQAVIEGVTFSLADGLQCLRDSGTVIDYAALSGGGARSRTWARIIASVLNLPVTRYAGGEAGPAFGAARLAMMAVGIGSALEICRPPAIEEIIEPDPQSLFAYRDKHAQFRRLYARLRDEFHSGQPER